MKDRPRADALLLERFSRHAGRGINRFDMIGPGDRILIGVSGGKDSLALSLALQERRKWVPIDYELFAVQVEWREYPMTDEEKAAIDGFFDGIGIPLRRIQAQIAPPTFGKKFSCYTCARNRKRILFDEATRIGARKIALGHHMDDIARTTLMNMFFHGELSTMMPGAAFLRGQAVDHQAPVRGPGVRGVPAGGTVGPSLSPQPVPQRGQKPPPADERDPPPGLPRGQARGLQRVRGGVEGQCRVPSPAVLREDGAA